MTTIIYKVTYETLGLGFNTEEEFFCNVSVCLDFCEKRLDTIYEVDVYEIDKTCVEYPQMLIQAFQSQDFSKISRKHKNYDRRDFYNMWRKGK